MDRFQGEQEQFEFECPECGSLDVADYDGFVPNIGDYCQCMDCGYKFLAKDEHLTEV